MITFVTWFYLINPSYPGQNGHHFTYDLFKCIFMNENFCILIKISQNFIPKGPMDNKSVLVPLIAWCQTGDKPLSESMLTQFTDAYMWHWREMSWYSIVDLMICPWCNWLVFVITAYPSCTAGMYIMIDLTIWILTYLPLVLYQGTGSALVQIACSAPSHCINQCWFIVN